MHRPTRHDAHSRLGSGPFGRCAHRLNAIPEPNREWGKKRVRHADRPLLWVHHLTLDHNVMHYLHMATRMNERAVRRTTLPLTARDERDLDAIRSAPEYQEAMAAALDLQPGERADVTDSVMLHFIFTRGLQSIQEEIEAAAYDRAAEERRATSAARRAVARRRQPSWANED